MRNLSTSIISFGNIINSATGLCCIYSGGLCADTSNIG